MSVLSHQVEGDKFARLRDRITDGIGKDKATARILDLATGRGYQARSIWDHGYRNVWACDLVPERVTQARALHCSTGIEFLQGNAGRLGFPDAFFDGITISAALHDMAEDDVVSTLSECARIAADGGRLQILEPRCLTDIRFPLLRSLYPHIADCLDESVHMGGYLRLNIKSMVENRGFDYIALVPLWGHLLCLSTFDRSRH